MTEQKQSTDLADELKRRDNTEAAIKAKVAAGLTREQAIAALKNQERFDKHSADVQAAREKAAKARAAKEGGAKK